eukprot:Tbor_TRINITY_DN5748_c4_g2::TRINITY_DN5748_c4_g2_i1::g.20709::m.20709
MNILPSSSSHLSLLDSSFQCINDTISNQLQANEIKEDDQDNDLHRRQVNIKDGVPEGIRLLSSWDRYRQVGLTGEKGLTLLRMRGKCENSQMGPLVKGKGSFMLKVKSSQYTTDSVVSSNNNNNRDDYSSKSLVRKKEKKAEKRRLNALSSEAKAAVRQSEVQENAAKTRMKLKLEINHKEQDKYNPTSIISKKKNIASMTSSGLKQSALERNNKNSRNVTNQPSYKQYIIRQVYRSKVARRWASSACRQITGATSRRKRIARRDAVKVASFLAFSLRQNYKKELVKQVVVVGKKQSDELNDNIINNNNNNSNNMSDNSRGTIAHDLAVRSALAKCFPLIGAFVTPKHMKKETKHPTMNTKLRKALGINKKKIVRNNNNKRSLSLQCIHSGIVIHETRSKVLVAIGRLRKNSKISPGFTQVSCDGKGEEIPVVPFVVTGQVTSVEKNLVKEIHHLDVE